MARVWLFGDNIDTDQILPGRYAPYMTSEAELGKYPFVEARPEFAAEVHPGDVIVAGGNFGCGSSREHAPVAIQGCGVSCVIAETFARIFFRNAINIGLPILECPGAAQAAQSGQRMEVDLASGTIHNLDSGQEFRATPYPPFMLEIIDAGGLVEYTRGKLDAEGAA